MCARCFLFLVNYARIKPEVALKALPVLVVVSNWVVFGWGFRLRLTVVRI